MKKTSNQRIVAAVTEPAPKLSKHSRAYIRLYAQGIIRTGNWAMEKFRENFDKYGSAHAFEWSREAFEGAAKINVGQQLLAWVERDDIEELGGEEKFVASIIKHVHDQVVRGARWPERSTSPQSNEMKACITAQFAEFYASITRKEEC